MNNRERLLNRIGDLANPATLVPVVTLEEFFEGNTFSESIDATTNEKYDPQLLFSIFKQFREIEGIHDVFVEVKGTGNPDKWPTTNVIWVVAAADPRHYRSDWPAEIWDSNLPCDYETYPRKHERPAEPIDIPAGMIARAMVYW